MKINKFIAQSPIFALYRGNSLLVEPFQMRLAKEGVHLLQGLILTALFFEEREVRPFELAKAFQVSKSNLSHSLRSLEKKGWLKRAMHSEDARGYLFSLTASGKKKALILIKSFDEVEGELEKKIGTKNTKEFVNVLNQFVTDYRSN
ncbi:MAG TPA: winged helix DNA-binding protein [Pseudobdellovibrionaceae bacterium]|jgi:DNA-binding MarR family transcriptional regulator